MIFVSGTKRGGISMWMQVQHAAARSANAPPVFPFTNRARGTENFTVTRDLSLRRSPVAACDQAVQAGSMAR